MGKLIKITEQPDDSDRKAIVDQLFTYNESTGAVYDLKSFAILIKDPRSGETAGGLWATCYYDWLHIELIFVPKELRGRKIGARLVRSAERWALRRGCVGVWLDTFEFQAPAFYQSLGYETFGHLPNYPRGSRRYFLRKEFSEST
ncbi:GNAT family N-acetyltransferase [Mesorhizobium sp. M4A.F.Ca.ET.022.05.2.1]|uniref:GNAT family N-acetyltransferase n=1 Tax=Mesorhizobium sp. M4A.F.Ca.ET.022.05.2.1 TaxID=2496653 RepID=UPI000FCB162D|nr:GNAT family N-acetyltransferase [Mesorhizobium sp. M4A.F.Ca.ET.022.05.2.1]RVC84015.1 GNAT family N-acetyltransferase [Mesorhizobium sp. M4A.F.Ca.ET.022.05.2.1]